MHEGLQAVFDVSKTCPPKFAIPASISSIADKSTLLLASFGEAKSGFANS